MSPAPPAAGSVARAGLRWTFWIGVVALVLTVPLQLVQLPRGAYEAWRYLSPLLALAILLGMGVWAARVRAPMAWCGAGLVALSLVVSTAQQLGAPLGEMFGLPEPGFSEARLAGRHVGEALFLLSLALEGPWRRTAAVTLPGAAAIALMVAVTVTGFDEDFGALRVLYPLSAVAWLATVGAALWGRCATPLDGAGGPTDGHWRDALRGAQRYRTAVIGGVALALGGLVLILLMALSGGASPSAILALTTLIALAALALTVLAVIGLAGFATVPADCGAAWPASLSAALGVVGLAASVVSVLLAVGAVVGVDNVAAWGRQSALAGLIGGAMGLTLIGAVLSGAMVLSFLVAVGRLARHLGRPALRAAAAAAAVAFVGQLAASVVPELVPLRRGLGSTLLVSAAQIAVGVWAIVTMLRVLRTLTGSLQETVLAAPFDSERAEPS